METSLAYSNTKPWGDLLYEQEQAKKMALLRMTQHEWITCVNLYFDSLRGNGRALLSALSWFTQMEGERAAFNAPQPVPEMDEATRTWRVWTDMVEEPWKYGSDIGEWIAVDEEARRGPKRWRVDAYWYDVVREMEETEKEAAATKLLLLWRGYQARHALAHRFTCARCLTHKVCWVPFEDRMHWLCTDCATEWSAVVRAASEAWEREEEMEDLSEEDGGLRRLR